MVWPGVIVFFIGAILLFAVDGNVGSVDVGTVGILTMILGAALLAVGLFRLERGRRRAVSSGHRPASGGQKPVSSYQDRVYRTGKGKMFAMIMAVVYILSPIDIVPDVFLPVGIFDDATAFSWLLFAVGQEITRKRRKAV